MLSKIKHYVSGNSRGAVVKRNAIGSFIIKIYAMAIQFIQVPIVLSYLDKEAYGVYLTITSMVMWAHNFDFGLGGGLRYKLTEALALNDVSRSKHLISTAYFSLAAIMTIAAIIIIPITYLVDWNALLNCHNLRNSYLHLCIIAVLITFLIQFVLDLITIVLQAKQKTAVSSMFRPIANTIAVVGVICLKQFSHNSLFDACLVLTIPLVIVLLVTNLWLFSTEFKGIAPSITLYRKNMLKDIYSLGTKFFLSSLSSLIIFNSANILLSHIIDPAEVAIYQTTYTYFATIIVFHGVILTPFWPAITNAFVQNDLQWLNGCMNKLAKLTIMFSLGALILAAVSKFAFHIWIGGRLVIPSILVCFLCLYAICNIWSAIYNCFIVGVGKVQITMYLSIAKILIYLPIAIPMIKSLGVIGLVSSLIIVNTIPNIILPYIQYRRIISGTASGIWDK